MNLAPTEKRNIVVNLIGYGKPDSNLWIMGYEESIKGKFTKDTPDDIFLKYEKGYTSEITSDYLKKTAGTYKGYYKLISNAFPENINGSNFFITNLLPFGKKDSNTELSPEECKIFECNNYEELLKLTTHERCQSLVEFFEKYKWRDKYIIFCIGSSDNKKDYLYNFLSKLYKVDKNELLKNIFIQNDSAIYLLHDNEYKKFITYQASYQKPRKDIAFDRIKALRR